MDFIRLSEVKRQLFAGADKSATYPHPVDVDYISFSKSRNSGGKVIQLKSVLVNSVAQQHLRTVSLNPSRNPSHDSNLTVNFKSPDGSIQKAYWFSIIRFNGKEVIL